MNRLKAILLVSVILISQSLFSLDHIQKINTRLDNIYKSNDIKPNGRVNDDLYVRRAYMQIAGRIPTYEEYNGFINNPSKSKRHELVDRLVNSEDFVSNWYNYWADILRPTDRLTGVNYLVGEPYIEWIKQSIRSNKRYDIFVSDMLTSTGNIYDNPATGYFWKDRGMPLDNLAGTSEIFFGTDISCAQCHDDPFQDWTQLDYYKFAAFFAQNQENRGTKEEIASVDNIRKTIIETRKKHEDEMASESDTAELDDITKKIVARGSENRITQLLRASTINIQINEKKTVKLPHDYAYEDAKPNDVVEPAFLFGKNAEMQTPNDYRKDFATWGTSPENPLFAKNAANRFWDRIFGAPVISPINNIPYPLQTIDENLIKDLEQIFKDVNYDFKQFVTILYKTNLFERYPYTKEVTSDFKFQGPLLRRLTAEQMWDSIATLYVDDINYFKDQYAMDYIELMSADITTLDIKAAVEMSDKYNEIRRSKYKNAEKYKSLVLVRSSDITIPNATSNILRELGQSEKILIQDSTRDGSVTQVISFMNGPVSEMISDKKSKMFKLIDGKDRKESIDIVYQSILQRKPTLQERSNIEAYNIEDIMWALINSHEFKFN